MHRPAIDIYSGTLVDMTTSCLEDLRQVFRSEGRIYIYAANGHGAWEAALVNVLSRSDKILVLETASLRLPGVKWRPCLASRSRRCRVAGAVPSIPQRSRRGFVRIGWSEIKAIFVVQVDTASGSVNDIPAMRKAIDAAEHSALLMVDTIASLATMPFEMDGWGVDVAVAGSQKGLMMPPGLSFVAAGEKALAAHRAAGLRTPYWDWTAREGELHYQKYCGTPPEHMLFGLRRPGSALRRGPRECLPTASPAGGSGAPRRRRVGRGRGIRFQCPGTGRTRRFGDNRENA